MYEDEKEEVDKKKKQHPLPKVSIKIKARLLSKHRKRTNPPVNPKSAVNLPLLSPSNLRNLWSSQPKRRKQDKSQGASLLSVLCLSSKTRI